MSKTSFTHYNNNYNFQIGMYYIYSQVWVGIEYRAFSSLYSWYKLLIAQVKLLNELLEPQVTHAMISHSSNW